MEVQRCDQTSNPEIHGDAHQKWSFANNSFIKNMDTHQCADITPAKKVQQRKCDGTSSEWMWLPTSEKTLKAIENGRLWVY
mmetsp:Transcript_3546/g.6997  ORF Transcript_3546/g.6997 Transcript_3546/m.6997 type:complete len:81 (-) Transcript_3546:14-256(-)